MKQCTHNPALRYIGAVVLLALLLGLIYNLTLSPAKISFSPEERQTAAEEPAAAGPVSEQPAEVEQ